MLLYFRKALLSLLYIPHPHQVLWQAPLPLQDVPDPRPAQKDGIRSVPAGQRLVDLVSNQKLEQQSQGTKRPACRTSEITNSSIIFAGRLYLF